MLINLLTWYLTLQLFALAGLPLAWGWLRALRSRGYAAAKALGLLLSGVIFWWGGLMHLWSNATGAVLTAAAIVFALGLWTMRGRWHELRAWWRENRTFVLVAEALFALTLIAWALVRAAQPQLETAGGEKWMEIAFLNAVLRAPHMPPHDPWLSGYAISYYYLGYVLMGMLTRVANLPAAVAFNLCNAGWFALAAVTAYGIIYDLRERRDALRPLLAPLLLLVTGNGQGLLEVLHARGLFPPGFWAWLDIRNINTAPQPHFSWVPTRFFWWWQAARTLRDYTPWGDSQEVIDEFPAFSFTLGDMHPHVLALPFVLLVIALALHIYRSQRRAPHVWTLRRLLPRFARLGGAAVLLGALGFLNTWDFPIYWALVVGAMVLGRLTPRGRELPPLDPDAGESPDGWPRLFDLAWRTLPEAVVLGILSVLCYFPFWWGLRSQAGGVLPNLFNATHWPQFVVMFLPLLLPIIGLIVQAAYESAVRADSVLVWGLGLVLGIAVVALVIGMPIAYPYLKAALSGEAIQGIQVPPQSIGPALVARLSRPWVGLALAFGAGAAIAAMLGHERERPLPVTATFPLLMALLGVLLTLAPEFVYLQDVFMTRMNTIFKFYFQAWVLWSLAGAWQLARWLTPRRDQAEGLGRVALAGLSLVLVAAGLVYTLLAVPARAREHGVPWTLDGSAWLHAAHPADAEAIDWLNANVAGTPVIAEAPGDEHRAYVYEGRVAALTGLPTVLGWSGHERQWRGNYDEPARREQDLQQLFTATDPIQVEAIVQRYDIHYLYIGPTERGRYPEATLELFAGHYPVVYQNQGVTIYEVGY